MKYLTALHKRLASIFWRHKWNYAGMLITSRTCKVCGKRQSHMDDGWGPTWATTYNGDQARHYSKGGMMDRFTTKYEGRNAVVVLLLLTLASSLADFLAGAPV